MNSFVIRSARLSFAGFVAAVLMLSCNGESPTAPSSGPVDITSRVSGIVSQESGSCLAGATVELLAGSQVASQSRQSVCEGTWEETSPGYVFFDLPPEVDVRIRVSKEGFRSQEIALHVGARQAVEANFVLANQ